MEDLTGLELGPYRIVAPLGEGGMAAVYKAYQPGVDRYVALKILPRHLAADPKFFRRFEQEAKTIANLQHIHILPVFDYGQDQGYTYFAMPLVETGTLADLLGGKPFPLTQIQQFISQVGNALDYAHTREVIHRDIKPSNILIDTSGNCLLTDFGISKILSASSTQLTSTGGVIGTPAYMSPEQGLGQELDHRSDIYSLGVVLYEMATGRQPYRAETPMAVIIKHINDPLPLPRSVNPTIPEAVERVILKALSKDRGQRFKTASEMVAALNTAIGQEVVRPPQDAPTSQLETLVAREQAISEGPGRVAQPASRPVTHKAGQRIPIWAWGGAGVILAGILFTVWALNRVEPPPPVTNTMAVIAVPATETAQNLVMAPSATPSPDATATPSRTPEDTPIPSQTLTPTLGPGATQISPADGMVMVFIPAGDFLMGSDGGNSDESPSHIVHIDPYWIDQTEITVGQFKQCVSAGACEHPPFPSDDVPGDYYSNPFYITYPAVDLSWQSAVTYCNWTGRRLPTEAEWEKSARGTGGIQYPWGDGVATGLVANFCDSNCNLDWLNAAYNDGYTFRSPVGSYPLGASPYGVLDTAGNVWEWVADWYAEDAYTNTSLNNPKGPPTGVERVVRGGSWGSTLQNLRVTKRFHHDPSFRFGDVGFRCAMDAP